LGISWICAII